jgi:hypothetical protein
MEHASSFAVVDLGGAMSSTAPQYEECFLCGSNDIVLRSPEEGLQLEFAENERSKLGSKRQAVVNIVECHHCGATYTLNTPE